MVFVGRPSDADVSTITSIGLNSHDRCKLDRLSELAASGISPNRFIWFGLMGLVCRGKNPLIFLCQLWNIFSNHTGKRCLTLEHFFVTFLSKWLWTCRSIYFWWSKIINRNSRHCISEFDFISRKSNSIGQVLYLFCYIAYGYIAAVCHYSWASQQSKPSSALSTCSKTGFKASDNNSFWSL